MIAKGVLTITLCSDLCAGSGYAYAGVIDSDICYDDFGLPYIPAKRLKGCMRESAQSILYDFISQEDVDKLFGAAGEKSCGLLAINNARITNYDKIVEELKALKKNGSEVVAYSSQQEILNQFTQIKAQTSIDENGVADDNTLRYTRVVKQYSPITNKPLVFETEITLMQATTDLEEILKKIALATRNIGMHRNRGMGSVTCKLVFDKEIEENTIKSSAIENKKTQEESQWVVLSYQLKNSQPLMLGSNDDQASETCIRGQRVLGVLAGTYLASKETSAQDQTFVDLFLAGQAIFTNLVPYKNGQAYYPAPLFLNQLKKTKKIVNTQFSYTGDANEEYDPSNGNQPKKLKGKYVFFDDKNRADIAEVEQTMIYHHSHYKKNADGVEGILYTQSAVQENQCYTGQVYVKEQYASVVKDLLEKSEFCFGRSRSAQYGKCVLLNKIENKNIEKVFFNGKKGQTVMVTLLSDGIFQSTKGTGYSIYYDDLQKAVAEELGIEADQTEQEKFHSMIQTKELNGYQTMWNLHKQTVPAVAAGSVFVYRLQSDIKITKRFIGEKNLEGYGQICIFDLNTMQYRVENSTDDNKKNTEKKTNEQMQIVIKEEAVKKLVINNLVESIKEKLKLKAAKEATKEKLRLSATTIGKATLMVQQSLEENRNNRDQAFCSFAARIKAVKREAERTELQTKVLSLIAKNQGEEWVLDEKKIEAYSIRKTTISKLVISKIRLQY
ncbi:hypothetical protein DWY36_16515 [Firmicutes bacterium AF25-13AC]|nr:hypothetical protein DWY36_16515 [Firmicutes bacterium AF25-13AC]